MGILDDIYSRVGLNPTVNITVTLNDLSSSNFDNNSEEGKILGIIKEVYNYLKSNGLSTRLLEKNLNRNLKFIKKSNDVAPANYKGSVNTIEYSDLSYLYHELIHVAMYDNDKEENCYGPEKRLSNSNKLAVSISEGMADFFAERINTQYIGQYPIEKLVIEMLYRYYGNIFTGVFNNDYDEFIKTFGDKKEEINNLINELDNYERLYIRIIYLIESTKLTKEDATEFNGSIEDIKEKLFLSLPKIDKDEYYKLIDDLMLAPSFSDFNNMLEIIKNM